MDTSQRDEAAIDSYFSQLGDNERIQGYDEFKWRIGFELTDGQSFTHIVDHFWKASRAGSMISKINRFAAHHTTKAANKFLSRKLTGLYGLFSAQGDAVTSADLEKMMAMHMRLQTVPTDAFLKQWMVAPLNGQGVYSDEWFKATFDHFTKLGIYPKDEFITAWWDTTKDRLDAFPPIDLFRMLYKLAQFDFLRVNDHAEIYAGVVSPCRAIADIIFDCVEAQAVTLFPEFINNQVFFAGLWFGKDFVRHRPVEGDDASQSSAFENDVAASIRKRSIMVNHDGMRVPVTGHKIDLKLIHDQKTYGCEVDGISHFNRIAGPTPQATTVIYNASTRFHSWLSAQYLSDVNILRVPYFLFDKDEAGIPWKKILSRIARKDGQSIYAWHGGSISRDLQLEKNAHLFRGHDL